MHVIARPILIRFGEKHPDAVRPLDAWWRKLRSATYHTPDELKADFRSADFLADNVVIFNIKSYRLVVRIRYPKTVFIRHVLTHPEYDALSRAGRL